MKKQLQIISLNVHITPYLVAAHRSPHIRSRSLCPVFKGSYLRDQPVLHSTSMLRRSDYKISRSLPPVVYLHPAGKRRLRAVTNTPVCPH